MVLLDGKKLSQKILARTKEKVHNLPVPLRLDVILVGEDYGSQKYVNMKHHAALDVGMLGTIHKLPEDVPQVEVLDLVKRLNNDSKVTGFMVQLPLPSHLNRATILGEIDYKKDVDGLTAYNLGMLFQNNEYLIPATPLGIITLLEDYGIEIAGKSVTVIGRSAIVGVPMAGLFINRNATVTVCHSKTINTKEITRKSDIVVSATGVAGLVKEDWVKNGAVLVDAGTVKDPKTGKLTGDVDFEAVKDKTSFITPVPGGVGPMTIASLISNTYRAFELKQLVI